MKNKIFISTMILSLLTLSACATTPATSSAEPATALPASPSATPTQEAFSDPFSYCAAVGQIDAPDSRYTGPQMSDELFKDYLKAAGLDPNTNYPPEFKKMTVWRCMDHKVYACNFGANIPCDSKANTDKTPTQAMIDFCKENQNTDFIPMSVTGHSVIYSWHCVKDAPEILDQIGTVDAAGYQSSFWQALEPVFPSNPSAPTNTPVSSAVGTPSGGSGQIVFYSNRDGGYNSIYLMSANGPKLTRLTNEENNSFSGPFSPDGNRLLFTGFGITHSYVGVMNADGSNPLNLTNQPGADDAFPSWSPDGGLIVFTSHRDGNNEIYVMNDDGSNPRRLTNNPKDDFAPTFSPDGKQITFVSDRDNATGFYSVYIMNADGSDIKRLTNDKGNDYTPAWSPDGSQIAFRSVQNGQSDIYIIHSDGSGLRNLTNSPAEEWSPAWSPNGTLIAFQTNRDGNWEIYLIGVEGSHPTNLTNNPADDQLPYWKKQ